jgi:hypothetical protein
LSLFTKVGSFNTGMGLSNIVVSGIGFQPKFIIFHWNGRTEVVDAVGTKSIDFGWGFAVGAADRRALGTHSLNGANPIAGGSYHSNAACIINTDTGAGLDGAADVVSFDADGFTLAIDNAFSLDLRVMYIAVGGDDIQNVKTGQYSGKDGTGLQSITGVGFKPDILFTIIPINMDDPPDGEGAKTGGGFGVAKSSAEQYVVTYGSDDGTTPSDTGSYIFKGEFVACATISNPLVMRNRQSLVSMDADGFTFDQLKVGETAGFPDTVHYLAIQGGQWLLGDLETQTETTITMAENGMGFNPDLVIFASANRPLSTQDVGTANGQISFGAATSITERVAMAIMDRDGQAAAVTGSAVEYDAVYIYESTAMLAQGIMDLKSMHSDGFNAIMDNADPAQSFVFYIAAAGRGLELLTSPSEDFLLNA